MIPVYHSNITTKIFLSEMYSAHTSKYCGIGTAARDHSGDMGISHLLPGSIDNENSIVYPLYIPMETAIKKWGNSLAVRLPRHITRNLRWHEGSKVAIRERKPNVMIVPAPKPQKVPRRDGVRRESWSLLKAAEPSFNFWDNADDAIYDRL